MAETIKKQMDLDEYYEAMEAMEQTAQRCSPYEEEEPVAIEEITLKE